MSLAVDVEATLIAATLTLEESAARRWDAVVVGAGPAGALAARQLARLGVGVLLVDRATFPRGKVCGCCLNGAALAALASAGLSGLAAACGAIPLEEILLAAGRWSARVPLEGGMSLSRDRFDAALVSQAIAAGADFLPDTRAALGGVTAAFREVLLRRSGRNITVQAGVVIAADGLGGGFLARGGVADSPSETGSRLGAGVICADAPAFYRPGVVYMTCGAHGYLGLVRLEDNRLDLAAALDADWLRACGGPAAAAAALLDDAGWPAPPNLAGLPWRGTPALTRRAQHQAAERLFVLGDAAGYVEPFTGEGMAWALSAAVALAPLAARAADRWEPLYARIWPRRFHRLIIRSQLACRAAAFVLRRPLLSRILIAVLARVPTLARPVLRRLHSSLVL